MTRIGRSSDWLGDVSEESFLRHEALPRKTRDVKFTAIKTAADAREYARRFFHGAVDSAAKAKDPAIVDRWALAAKQYVLAHDLAGQGGALADVKIGLSAADTNSATAIAAGKGKVLLPVTPWSPPTQDSPPEASGSSSTTSTSGSPTSSRTEVRSPTSTSTSTEATTHGNVTVTGGAGAGATTTVNLSQGDSSASSPATASTVPLVPGAEEAPATVPGEWLVSSLLPQATSRPKLETIKTLSSAIQYARRFFHGAVDHGTKSSAELVRQRWAEAARIYVYAARLAADPFIDGALEAVLNDLRAADILSAQAMAAEKGGALAPVAIRWFTSPELAKRGLATFELVGSLELPGKTPATPGAPATQTASLETTGGLPHTFDVLIDRFRGPLIPRAFLRALIMAESGFNPSNQNPTSDARGLLQVTAIVLADWNKNHPDDQVTPDQLFDPATNLKLGIGVVRHIVESYDRAHPSMRVNFRSANYVEVIAEAWNVGYSERTGVGFILSTFERSGVPATVDNIVARAAQVAGLSEAVSARIIKRGVVFPRRVRQLYFGELERGEGEGGRRPQLLTAGIGEDGALVIFSGLLLYGRDFLGGRS